MGRESFRRDTSSSTANRVISLTPGGVLAYSALAHQQPNSDLSEDRENRPTYHTKRPIMKKLNLATHLFVTVCALTQLCDAAQMALKLEGSESYFEAPDHSSLMPTSARFLRRGVGQSGDQSRRRYAPE